MAFRCEQCSRDFSSTEGLEQHNRDKHMIKEKKAETQPAQSAERGKRSSKKKYAVIALILIVIAGLVYVGLSASPRSVSYTPLNNLDNLRAEKGDPNAPVVMEEFSDYQCPFCGTYARETAPLLEEEYVASGKVRMVFKDFPLPSHPNAPKAAEAAWCAADQGKYWEMHDALFANQNALGVASLKRYAAEIGVNTTLFDACLDSGIMAVKVRDAMEEGRRRGVSATPYFFVNGVVVRGAESMEQFRLVINSALAAAVNVTTA